MHNIRHYTVHTYTSMHHVPGTDSSQNIQYHNISHSNLIKTVIIMYRQIQITAELTLLGACKYIGTCTHRAPDQHWLAYIIITQT